MVPLITRKACSRPFLPLLLLIILCFPATGQITSLPLNNEDLIEYSHFIETDSGSYPVLWASAEDFLNTLSVPGKLNKKAQPNEDLTSLTHTFGFFLYIKPALTKQIDGVVMADITINISDTSYQYLISNFKFIEYARNRFGQFTPKSSKKYPLEKYIPKSNAKRWQTHFASIDKKMTEITKNLEVKMSELCKSD